MATITLTCPRQRQRAARLLRQLRTIGQWHVHHANPYARYYIASVGQPMAQPYQRYVAAYCLHMCYMAGFM